MLALHTSVRCTSWAVNIAPDTYVFRNFIMTYNIYAQPRNTLLSLQYISLLVSRMRMYARLNYPSNDDRSIRSTERSTDLIAYACDTFRTSRHVYSARSVHWSKLFPNSSVPRRRRSLVTAST